VLVLPGDNILHRKIGPPLVTAHSKCSSFWTHLRWIGGEWLWEHVVEGDTDVEWIRDALTNRTFLAVTNGSYDREKANTVSGSGWIIVCTACHQTLRGSFIEISPSTGSYRYRGKLLGLVAIHTFAIAIAQLFLLEKVTREAATTWLLSTKPARPGSGLVSGLSTLIYITRYVRSKA